MRVVIDTNILLTSFSSRSNTHWIWTDCAIAAQAWFLVTEDRHFDMLKQITFPRVSVIGLKTFRVELQQH